MKPDELRNAVREMIEEEAGENAWRISLLGEISVQLSKLNESIEAAVSYLRAIENNLQPKSISEPLHIGDTDAYAEVEDVNQDNS